MGTVQSGRGLPQSKTLRAPPAVRVPARFWTAAVLCRFFFGSSRLTDSFNRPRPPVRTRLLRSPRYLPLPDVETMDDPHAMNQMPNPELTYELFTGLEKTKVELLLDEHNRIEMELAEVLVLRQGAVKPGTSVGSPESFSLIFRGRCDQLLPQRTYVFAHEKIGRFELFIVPLGREAGAIQYQAIFNRLANPA